MRDKNDLVIVQEKLDGACTAALKLEGRILALQRTGYLAETSPRDMIRMFGRWVQQRESLFDVLLDEGERLVGEWLALAHGTRYELEGRPPWYPFDLMRGDQRATVEELEHRLESRGTGELQTPRVIAYGPTSVEQVRETLGHGRHGALDPAEGAVWRVERSSRVDFLTKWVRPEKGNGRYLPEISRLEPVWNVRPELL